MSGETDEIGLRLALIKARGVVLDAKDERRIAEGLRASLAALAKAAPGSIFDTEPAQFERALLSERRSI